MDKVQKTVGSQQSYCMLSYKVRNSLSFHLNKISPPFVWKRKKNSNKSSLNTTVQLSIFFRSKLISCRRNTPLILTISASFIHKKTFATVTLVTRAGELEKHRGVLCYFSFLISLLCNRTIDVTSHRQREVLLAFL